MLGTSAAPEGGTWIPASLNAMFESANRPSTKTPANGGQLWTFRVSRLFCHGLEPRSQKAHDEVATGFLS
jgi:hypothetical protein